MWGEGHFEMNMVDDVRGVGVIKMMMVDDVGEGVSKMTETVMT